MSEITERVYEDANDLLADRSEYLRVDVMKKDGSWHVVLRLDGGYEAKSGIPGFCAEDMAEHFRKHIGEMLKASMPDQPLTDWVNSK